MNKKPAPFLAAALTLALGWFGCSPSSNAPAAGTAHVSPTAPPMNWPGVCLPARFGPSMGLLDVDGRQPEPRGDHRGPRGDEKAGIGGVIICEVNVGIPRGPVDFMSPRVADALRACRVGGGTAGAGDHAQRRARLDRERRAVGQGRSNPCSISSPALSTSAGPAVSTATLPRPQRRPAFFGDGFSRRTWRRSKTNFTSMSPCWPSRLRPRPRHRRYRREGALCPGALFLQARREAIPPLAGGLSRNPRRRGDRPRPGRRPDRPALRRRPARLGRSGRPLDRSCVSAAPAPEPTPARRPYPGLGS